MARWLCLKEGAIKTDQGTVCMKRYDVVTLDETEVPKEYIEANYLRPLQEAQREKYAEYMRVLHEFEIVESEVKEKAPEFFKQVQWTINRIEEGFVKENYILLDEAIRHLKKLYLKAIRGEY
jgi:hypothetical protein